MVDSTGLLLALIASFFFGTYYVPLKRSSYIDPRTYQSFVGIGALIVGVTASILLSIPFQFNMIALLPGVIWAAGNLIGANAVKYIGVSGLPIGQGVVLLVSFLWGILFFGEPFQLLPLAFLGILMLLVGLPLVSIGKAENRKSKTGILLFIISGILWGSVYVPPLAFKMTAASIIPSILLGVFLAGAILFVSGARKFEKSNASNSILSGMIWAVGNVVGSLAIDRIGLALAGPLPQLAILVSIAWGVSYFREVKGRERIMKIVGGGVLLVLGAILLALAK